ncbi:hypothetical protein GJ699_01640 [Duganella sp. FT80W]|uniref:DUF1640 domain-containing protein n=1 Tax=Duganella guangzhouensis TaxID=2666084 RepID=A0A6I2KTI4_9BURK|nr:hypothetical protein [Duganella guangzhouensis]MRW88682.1 hypothetical protein [Duganella guangzhouensis]
MANDKRIELRVALQEHQMATLVEIVEEIRENFVTTAYLGERLSHLATKEDFARLESRMAHCATDEDMARLEEKQVHFATKEDLERVNQNMRNWIISVGVSITALQFAIQFAMFQLYNYLR